MWNLTEVTPAGITHLLTVFNSVTDGAFPAVYSRHSDVLGAFPSQHHGVCSARF